MAIANIRDIAYVIYRHQALDEAERFLQDFGLVPAGRHESTRYYRGSTHRPFCYILEQARPDERPSFVGFGVLASSAHDLDQVLSHPSAIGGIEFVPGAIADGARRVSLRDPAGFRVDLVWGMPVARALPHPRPLLINHSQDKMRQGATQRTVHAAAPIYRLGHLALLCGDVESSVRWYQEVLGMLLSDALCEERQEGREMTGAFLRCNRGDEWTDHHTVAVFETAKGASIHHASFEMTDLDALAASGHWLRRQGWSAEWGIGRHVAGSQIFDYWRDPAGFMLEHFTDGDIFTADKQTEFHQASMDMLYQWGPEVPQTWLP
jgi:catechol 2,3-dioxygenase-like lactoylglutathione lyase family enzyme